MSTLRIRDVGNSLGVIIPKSFSESLGLKAGKEVTIEIKERALVIKPCKYVLEEFVAKMIPEISTHVEIGAEIVEYDVGSKEAVHDQKRKSSR